MSAILTLPELWRELIIRHFSPLLYRSSNYYITYVIGTSFDMQRYRSCSLLSLYLRGKEKEVNRRKRKHANVPCISLTLNAQTLFEQSSNSFRAHYRTSCTFAKLTLGVFASISEAIQKKRSRNEVRDDKLWYILPAACHRGRRKPVRDLKEKAAFTLAEVLITLGIIGIVAALTMPMLIAKYQKIVTATQLKRTYSLLYNAHLMAVKDFGDMEYWDMPISSSDPDTGEYIPPKITQTEFVEKYYMPYLRTSGARDHKFTDTYHAYNFNGQDAYFHDGSIVRGAFFRLADGSCITLWSNNQFATFTTDVNCEKAPNIVGRDIFDIVTVYDTGKRKFEFPQLPTIYMYSRKDIIERCKGGGYGGGFPTLCFLVFTGDGWTFKDDYPWK